MKETSDEYREVSVAPAARLSRVSFVPPAGHRIFVFDSSQEYWDMRILDPPLLEMSIRVFGPEMQQGRSRLPSRAIYDNLDLWQGFKHRAQQVVVPLAQCY